MAPGSVEIFEAIEAIGSEAVENQGQVARRHKNQGHSCFAPKNHKSFQTCPDHLGELEDRLWHLTAREAEKEGFASEGEIRKRMGQ